MENIDKLKKRQDIDSVYKWNLGDMYSSLEEWENDYKDIKKRLPTFALLSGRLEKSPDILPEILGSYSSLMKKVEKLFIYAHMLKDQDNTNTDSQALLDRARSLMVETESNSSYLVPEILKMKPDILEDLMKSDNRLSDYTHYLKNISRQRKHILSHEFCL